MLHVKGQMSMWPLGLYRVNGVSMQPTYQPGDLLLGWRWFRPRVGQVVVAVSPERSIIKRIKDHHDTDFWLEGDNVAYSTDSRSFGPVLRRQIQALIIAKIR